MKRIQTFTAILGGAGAGLSGASTALDYSAPATSVPGRNSVHAGFLWVEAWRGGQLKPGTQARATLRQTAQLHAFDNVNSFKTSGFLPSSEPAIGRSQEPATDGWCRRTAELPLLVELERAAYPQ